MAADKARKLRIGGVVGLCQLQEGLCLRRISVQLGDFRGHKGSALIFIVGISLSVGVWRMKG